MTCLENAMTCLENVYLTTAEQRSMIIHISGSIKVLRQLCNDYINLGHAGNELQ